jgi:NADH-quinone oxidoreductase subunit F
MDLRLLLAEPSEEEREAVDAVTRPAELRSDGRVVRGGHEARDQRHLLLPALRAVQRRVGWISEGALAYVCSRLRVPPADAYGVATFYHMLSLEPRPARVVHVCDDLACRLKGAEALIESAGVEVERSPCLGLCERAPAALVTEAGLEPREYAIAPATAADLADPEPPQVTKCCLEQAGSPVLRLLRRVGVVDPTSIDDYRAHGGYAALRRALELGPEGVLREVTASKLLGRGGAAFPTGIKWGAVARAPERPHYLVCNADESEPGTFKDRVLMESDPFAVIEAMTIAGITCGCERGYLYVRAEYPLAHERLGAAIEHARAHGFLGDDVMGRGLTFEIELRHGAGAYICGEETALFNSIEGLRGEPRNKPPFPSEHGLFGKPTVVNNVETLVNVLDIVLEGGDGYAAIGTEGSTGTRLFCVSGNVERPGLYELPFGATLRELLELARADEPKAVLLGGAAGTFVSPDDLDLPLTFEDTRAAGATLGSGVVLVYGQEADLVDACLRIAEFFRDESCGQCVPCRVGTVRQEEALRRLAARATLGRPEDEFALLEELAQAMRDASICGLGQTAWSAVQSAINRVGVFA